MSPQELQIIKDHAQLLQQFIDMFGNKPKKLKGKSRSEERRLEYKRKILGLQK